jgi:hypothetical protein
MQTCKAKDGDVYSTLAGTKLTVVKEPAAHNGRKLQQVGLWHTAACFEQPALIGAMWLSQALLAADSGNPSCVVAPWHAHFAC